MTDAPDKIEDCEEAKKRPGADVQRVAEMMHTLAGAEDQLSTLALLCKLWVERGKPQHRQLWEKAA